jgi:hypothetical protein
VKARTIILSAVLALVLASCEQQPAEILAPPFPLACSSERFHRAGWVQVVPCGKSFVTIYHAPIWRVTFETEIGPFELTGSKAYEEWPDGSRAVLMISAVYAQLPEVQEHEVRRYELVSILKEQR